MGAKSLSSRAIIGEFYATLEQDLGNSWINSLSNYFPSDQEAETYKWLGQTPAMREWIGGRQAKGLTDNGITIANKDFEATLEIMVKDLRRYWKVHRHPLLIFPSVGRGLCWRRVNICFRSARRHQDLDQAARGLSLRSPRGGGIHDSRAY